MNAAELWNEFEHWEFPVHSLILCRGNEVLRESYREPYQADTLHRMFSITKSYTALAVGCLAGAGKLSLDDPIVRYFPEYLPVNKKVHPYLAEMTVRHMLMMQTCHETTTYKLDPARNWVESFFTTPPSHRSGRIFSYDTSSSHTLAALVKKLAGLGILDYLRACFLEEIGFSRDAYLMKDPFGAEMGGSGMMAYPRDLSVTARYLMTQIQSGAGGFVDFLREAVGFQTPTRHAGRTIDEQQGYGYHFWRIRNGFAMYGMGGQYVLFYPEIDTHIVITADSQNIKGGSQKILDAVYELTAPAYSKISPAADPADRPPDIVNISCPLAFNDSGFTALTLDIDKNGGVLMLTRPEIIYQIPFALEPHLRLSTLAKYHEPIASSAQWLENDALFIYSQITGERVGSLTFMIRLRPDGLTVRMKKVEESAFHEFCGFAESAGYYQFCFKFFTVSRIINLLSR